MASGRRLARPGVSRGKRKPGDQLVVGDEKVGREPRLARASWLRTWRFAVVGEVLDEQSSPVHGVYFTADAMMKFRQLANKLPVITSAAYLCNHNRD